MKKRGANGRDECVQETISFMMINMLVGGVIGGGTNRLAIAMLFRPHRIVHIGQWALPFTPGLIPKRRKELALQLGRTVREYLVNGEALNRTIRNPDVRERIVDWAKSEWERARQNQRLQKWVQDFITLEEKSLQLEREMRVSDWVSHHTEQELRNRIANWAPTINAWLMRYLASDKGSETLRKVYGDWTRNQGWVGRLTGSLFDEARVAEKSKQWLIQMLAAPQGLDTTRALLSQGVDAVLSWHIRDIITWAERQSDGAPRPESDHSVETMIERLIPYMLDNLASRGEEWLDLLQLDQLVSEQIETFSLPKLEEMIIRVAKKELRLITWIGALIGAVIGLCQGVIATLLF